MNTMSAKQERDAIKESTKEAVVEVLLALGVDISDPDAVRQMQKDMHWVRRGRQASERMPNNLRKAGIGVAATVMAYMLWEGLHPFTQYLKGLLSLKGAG